MVRQALASLIIVPILGACLNTGVAQDKLPVLEHPYYPLEIGNKWTYRAGDQKVVISVDKLADIDMKKEKDDKISKVPAHRLVITKEDRELTEYIAVLPDGIYRFGGDGKELAPPVRILKLKLTPGESWDVRVPLQGGPVKGTFTASEGEVTVPAGTYKTMIVSSSDFQIGTQKMSLKYWFADQVARGAKSQQRTWQPAKVGIVKQEVKYGTYSVTLELEKFEPAK